jgi:predicted transcriptional regulator
MLTIQNSRIDYTEQQKSKILEIASDQYCRKILSIIKKDPKSAVEISEETKIPISTVYRRLQMLHAEKLLRNSGTINQNGKKSFLYKSKINSISTFFNGDHIEIEIIPNAIEKSQGR